ncbi:MAG: hypothetical protein JWR69_380 [Pedosphaera sp.]|nr:hypothetical protein [Pedosphaera sp.]
MDRIKLIESSLRCFAMGLVGLVPVLGMPIAVLALLQFRKAILHQGGQWNPAGNYLIWGAVCGGLGLLISTLVFGLVMYAILNSLSR